MQIPLILVLDYTEKESDEDCLNFARHNANRGLKCLGTRSRETVSAISALFILVAIVCPRARAIESFDSYEGDAQLEMPISGLSGNVEKMESLGDTYDVEEAEPETPALPLMETGRYESPVDSAWSSQSASPSQPTRDATWFNEAPAASSNTGGEAQYKDLSDPEELIPTPSDPSISPDALNSDDAFAPTVSSLYGPQEASYASLPSTGLMGTNDSWAVASDAPVTGGSSASPALADDSERLLGQLRAELDLDDDNQISTPAPKAPMVAMSAANFQTHLLADSDETPYTPLKALRKKRRRPGPGSPRPRSLSEYFLFEALRK